MLPYGRPLRRLRSAFHHGMGASVIHPYRPIQHEEVKRHLLRMLDNPKDFGESGRKCVFRLTRTRSRPTFTIACLLQRPIVIRMIGAMIMRIVYGLDVYGPDEKYIQIAEKSMECFSAVFNPGRYLVQTLPCLRFVPAWFPGAGFQREFAAWRPQVAAARDLPWEATSGGCARPAMGGLKEEGELCVLLSLGYNTSDKWCGVFFSGEATREFPSCFFFQHANGTY